jgi:rhamnosyltransferase
VRCSVVVRVLNEKENLNHLINLLKNQKKVEFELIVIDSGSDDGTLEMLNNYIFNYPFYLTSIKKEEFSFGRSLNQAIKLSRFKELVVSISAHCFPTNDYYLYNLLKHFEDKNIGMVYGRQIGDSRSPLSEVNHLTKWFPEKNNFTPNIFCNNGSSAFRYSDWENLEFNEDVTGCEDILYSLELSNIKKSTIYEPNSIVTHFHNEDFRTIFKRYKRESNLIKSLFNHNLNFVKIVYAIFNEVYSDILFRKNKNYTNSRILDIVKYRVAKNFGQLLGQNDSKFFVKKYSEIEKMKLLNHYYY